MWVEIKIRHMPDDQQWNFCHIENKFDITQRVVVAFGLDVI